MQDKNTTQLRQYDLEKLAHFASKEPTDQEMAMAKRLMNSFYRLCRLAERNLYLATEEHTCNLKSTAASERREMAWADKLSAELKSFCGLEIVYLSWCPSIGRTVEHGGIKQDFHAWMY